MTQFIIKNPELKWKIIAELRSYKNQQDKFDMKNQIRASKESEMEFFIIDRKIYGEKQSIFRVKS